MLIGSHFSQKWSHLTRQGSVDVDLFGVVEIGEELVVLLVTERVELVVVALSAAHGQAEPGGAYGLDPVDHLFMAELVHVDSALSIAGGVAVKPGSDFLLPGGAREEISGNLFQGEAVEGHVLVEGLDQPVAIAPGVGSKCILAVTVTVRIAGQVQPMAGPFFSKVG